MYIRVSEKENEAMLSKKIHEKLLVVQQLGPVDRVEEIYQKIQEFVTFFLSPKSVFNFTLFTKKNLLVFS